MLFEVRVPNDSDTEATATYIVEARDWFSALQAALAQKGEDTPLRNVMCDLVEENIYRVTEASSQRIFEIQEAAPGAVPTLPSTSKVHSLAPELPPLPESTQTASNTQPTTPTKSPKALQETMQMDFAAIIEAQKKEKTSIPATVEFREFASKEELEQAKASIIVTEEAYSTELDDLDNTIQQTFVDMDLSTAEDVQTTKISPEQTLSENLTGASGHYQPGMTTEMLANAFMRASEIHEHGTDKQAAMKFVLDLALSDIEASGGGILLTDLNSPRPELWFEALQGTAHELHNMRVPLGQGIIGYYTQQGIHQTIPDISREPRYEEDLFYKISGIGPMLCVPIVYNDRIWGCIVLHNPPGHRAFTQGELSIVTYLAHTSGEYLSALQ